MARRPKHDAREAILEATARLILDRPFAFFTLNDIIETAGVTRSTFYSNFHSKEDLAAQFVATEFDGIHVRVIDRLADVLPSIERIVALLFESTFYLLETPRFHAAMRLQTEVGRVASCPPLNDIQRWHDLLTTQVAYAVAAGDLPQSTEPASVARHILDVWTGTRVLSDMSTGHADLVDRIEGLLLFVLGIAVVPERVDYVRTYVQRYAARVDRIDILPALTDGDCSTASGCL